MHHERQPATEASTPKPVTRFGFALSWMIAGFLLAHIVGMSYVAAARNWVGVVFETFHETMEEELMEMPPSIQLVASYASKQALDAAVRKNSSQSILEYLFPGKRVDQAPHE